MLCLTICSVANLSGFGVNAVGIYRRAVGGCWVVVSGKWKFAISVFGVGSYCFRVLLIFYLALPNFTNVGVELGSRLALGSRHLLHASAERR